MRTVLQTVRRINKQDLGSERIKRSLKVKNSKNPPVRTYFFRVKQNRFLYFGVLTGILG